HYAHTPATTAVTVAPPRSPRPQQSPLPPLFRPSTAASLRSATHSRCARPAPTYPCPGPEHGRHARYRPPTHCPRRTRAPISTTVPPHRVRAGPGTAPRHSPHPTSVPMSPPPPDSGGLSEQSHRNRI